MHKLVTNSDDFNPHRNSRICNLYFCQLVIILVISRINDISYLLSSMEEADRDDSYTADK